MRVWSEVLAAALAGDLPLAPVLVHGSPMQEWLRSNISRPWDVPALKRVVASSQVGDWKVQLKRQRGSTTFVYRSGVSDWQRIWSIRRLCAKPVWGWIMRRPSFARFSTSTIITVPFLGEL